MKYIRTYEKLNIDLPKVGDYVYCYEDAVPVDSEDLEDYNKFLSFLSNNIGKCVDDSNDFLIQYYNVPLDLSGYFEFGIRFAQFNGYILEKFINCRAMCLEEIEYFSSNKEDCEVYLNAKKYNL